MKIDTIEDLERLLTLLDKHRVTSFEGGGVRVDRPGFEPLQPTTYPGDQPSEEDLLYYSTED